MKTSLLNQLGKEITQGEWKADSWEGPQKKRITTTVAPLRHVATAFVNPFDMSVPIGGKANGSAAMEANALAISLTPQLIKEVLELRECLAGFYERAQQAGWHQDNSNMIVARALLTRHETTNQ